MNGEKSHEWMQCLYRDMTGMIGMIGMIGMVWYDWYDSVVIGLCDKSRQMQVLCSPFNLNKQYNGVKKLVNNSHT